MGRARRRPRNRTARARARAVARTIASKRVLPPSQDHQQTHAVSLPLSPGTDRPADPVDLSVATDPAVAVQLEEALSTFTLKRRRFVLRYIETGNARQSVLAAGYNVRSPKNASDVATEILASPSVQHAFAALVEARGLSGAKLDQIHAIHLARHSSPDGGDRDRSLKALALAHKYVRPKPTAPGATSVADEILNEMTEAELEHFIATKQWPGRFRQRLLPSLQAGSDTLHHHGREERPDRVRDEVRPAYTPGPETSTPQPPSLAPEPSVPEPPARHPSPQRDWCHEVTAAEEELRAAQRPALDPALRNMALRDRRW
jgi:hypothetical protein